MIKPLIISNSYIQEKSPLGQMLRPQIVELVKRGICPTIVSQSKGINSTNCPSVELYSYKESSFIHNILAVVRMIIPDLSFLPDTEYYSWGTKAYNKAKELTRLSKFDYIHSISFSCANHLIAYKIKRQMDIPWVAQFYDPWYDNPDRRFKTDFFKTIDLRQEKVVSDYADLIIVYTQRMMEKWIERYGDNMKDKIVYLPQTISTALPPVEKHIRSGKLKITHIGNFQLQRNSIPFIEALNELNSQIPNLSSLVEVTYVGKVTEKEMDLINCLKLSSFFNIIGRVEENECNKYYHQADIFLAVDAPFENNVFFPSKVMKYLYFDKPILGITPSGSVLSEELKKSGHVSIDNGNIDEIVSYLKVALNDYSSLLHFNHQYWTQFSVDSVVDKFVQNVMTLIRKE